MLIRTVKEEMGLSLNLQAATTNKIYAILKIVPKFMNCQVAQCKSNSCKQFQTFTTVNIKLLAWLGLGLLNFSITLLKTLQEHVSPQKSWFKFQDFLGLFVTFSRTFCIKVSGIFQDFYGVVWIATTKFLFLQNKNIHPVVYVNKTAPSTVKTKLNTFCNIYYILLYWSFTPGNLSFILTYWLKGWKAESNY